MRRLIPLISVFAALAALLVSAIPAYAKPPDTSRFEEWVMIDPWTDCGDFTVREESLFRTTVTHFYNNAGELDRVQIDWHMLHGALINNSDPSKTLEFGPSNMHFFLSPDPPEFTQERMLGIMGRIKMPGGGTVDISAGQWRWDYTKDPPIEVFHGHPDTSAEGIALVCTALR